MLKKLLQIPQKAYFSYKLTKRYKGIGLAVLFALSIATVIFVSPISYAQTPRLEVTGFSHGDPPALIPSRKNSTSYELRGVWLTNIDSNVLFERDRLSLALERLHQLNFNTVYPTVWNWGYTLYPSRVAQRVIGRAIDPTPGLQGRDILREISQQGHQKGMAVIPWFEFGFIAPINSQLALPITLCATRLG